MNSFLEKINNELTKHINEFEQKNGNIEKFYDKQIKEIQHTMILEDIFIDPDIECLKKYEKELNGNN